MEEMRSAKISISSMAEKAHAMTMRGTGLAGICLSIFTPASMISIPTASLIPSKACAIH